MKEHEIEKAIQECIDRKARDPRTLEIEAICKALEGAWLRSPDTVLGDLLDDVQSEGMTDRQCLLNLKAWAK